MSASRPKASKPIPKPRTLIVEKPEAPRDTTPIPKPVKQLKAGRSAEKSIPEGVRNRVLEGNNRAKGKGRAAPATPASRKAGTAAEPQNISSDEDDFEEVPIPTTPAARSVAGGNASAGPSSPYPNRGTPTATTPGTNLTAHNTPAPITAGETDEDPYAEDDESEAEGDGVIRLEIGGETPEEKAKRIAMALRKKPMTSKDRILRIEVHKLHVIGLLANAKIRNRWANNMLLKARLLSLLPHPLVTAFSIPPSRFPDRAQRARLFVDALQSLVLWWTQTFFDVSDSTIGMRTRPWDEVSEVVSKLPRLTRSDFTPGGSLLAGPSQSAKQKEQEEEDRLQRYGEGAGGERLRTVNSLMKKALQQEGSRDVSAFLFVALCRACGLGTRLVVNLQAVPWRSEKVMAKKPSGAGKGGRTVASRQGLGSGEEDEDSMEEVPIPGEDSDDGEQGEGGPGEVMEKIKNKRIRGAGRRRQQDPAEVYRLRKPKSAVQTTGAAIKPKVKTKQGELQTNLQCVVDDIADMGVDLSSQPPVFWAEVFSRPDQKWFPVDPTRGTVRKRGHFEPPSDNGPVRMAYVIAFEEDGHARDVTLRYTKSFGAKTSKLRVPSRKGEPDWWEGVLGFLARPYRLNRDDIEDAELENSQISEAMPVHMNGFKDHPLFVLERHLKREEVIQPKREVGKFRGEPVFRRHNVLSCKTAENWMRVGRKVKDRQEPMKWVKQRAMTINKRREVELARQAGEESMQGLYAEGQTEIYRPPAIVDGKIPQNSFGNIDLYAPTMLPRGAAHLPYKGIAKVAKQLGISYAEACTGFEFKKQRAIPVITGIVVAEDQTEIIMDAYRTSNAAAEERQRQKKVEKALKRWGKLINALRVRERLRATYGDKEGLHDQSHNPLAEESGQGTPAKGKKSAASVLAQANQEASTAWAKDVANRSESPTPAPEEQGEGVTVHDFALDDIQDVKQEQPEPGQTGLPDEEEDDDMEEVEVDVPAARRASTPPDEAATSSRLEKPKLNGKVERITMDSPKSRVTSPEPQTARPKRVAAKLKVDNPYEDSSEDEQKGIVSNNDDADDIGESIMRQSARTAEDDSGGSELDEVDFPAKEPSPPRPKTTRSGRSIKLRVGVVKDEPDDPVQKRQTRSSKRKR